MIERTTPETDANTDPHLYNFVRAKFARKLERERDDYKWQLHIAKGEIAEARKMERAWKKEEAK